MELPRLEPAYQTPAPARPARAPEAPLPLLAAAMVLGLGLVLGPTFGRSTVESPAFNPPQPALPDLPAPAPAPAATATQELSGLDLVRVAPVEPNAARQPDPASMAATGALEAPTRPETLIPLQPATPPAAPPAIANAQPVRNPTLVRREFHFGENAGAPQGLPGTPGCNCGNPGTALAAQDVNWARPRAMETAIHAVSGLRPLQAQGLGPAIAGPDIHAVAGINVAQVNVVSGTSRAMFHSFRACRRR